MRTKLINLLLIICFSLLFFYGCSKDSSNPTVSTNFTAKGSDYFPITSGKILNAKVSGTSTNYDSLGGVTNHTQMSNQLYHGSIGASTLIGNVNYNPLYFFDNIKNASKLAGYLTNNNGEADGMDRYQNHVPVTLLPSEINIGDEWVVNPQSPPKSQIKVKLLEALDNYTNSAGISYKNVINLYIVYQDSTESISQSSNYFYQYYRKTTEDVNIYLAKDVGIVELKLNNYERIHKYTYISNYQNEHYYDRISANGVLGVTN